MSEGWRIGLCWALAVKRRSVMRKSGASCGHSDTYYQSPTNVRFRSKIEMQKFLGSSVDLSLFDFKNGVINPRCRDGHVFEVRKKKTVLQIWLAVTGLAICIRFLSCQGLSQFPMLLSINRLQRKETSDLPDIPDLPADRLALGDWVTEDWVEPVASEPALHDFSPTAPYYDAEFHCQNADPPPRDSWSCSSNKQVCHRTAVASYFHPGIGTFQLTVPFICWLCDHCIAAGSPLTCLKISISPKDRLPHCIVLLVLHQDPTIATSLTSLAVLWTLSALLMEEAIGPWLKKKRQSFPPDLQFESKLKKPRLSLPLPKQEKPKNNGSQEETLIRCQGCQVWFAEAQNGNSKSGVWYCANCRAFRRSHNKEQKHYKSVGCGTCTACKISENCGYCTVCLLRSHNPDFGSSWKCVRRRCLQIIRKGRGCGACTGCDILENCNECSVCLRRLRNPDKKVKVKCIKRRCENKKAIQQAQSKSSKKLNIKVKPLSERGSSPITPKHKKKDPIVTNVQQKKSRKKFAGRRNNRKCGECEACLQKLDCGKCDFCQDKPKFGGHNLKRQKCRWRQCLRFAMEKNIPDYHRPSVLLDRIKAEDASTEYIVPEEQDEELEDITTSPRMIKQEMEETIVMYEEDIKPLDLHQTVKIEEFISESDDIAEADESTPVIMEIFSLGDYHAMTRLDSVLQEFMNELNEIPLPAHWEVLTNTSPNLQLVQRSTLSTMADTVIHIQPGLHFRVVARGLHVPSTHELYNNHPSRLTTVDEVVELICDLEAYRLCNGIPRIGHHSPQCQVLVYEERCHQCCKAPWPSGSSM
ncbi:uncharacterized protein O3C94_010596 [Discoglossus pictus]